MRPRIAAHARSDDRRCICRPSDSPSFLPPAPHAAAAAAAEWEVEAAGAEAAGGRGEEGAGDVLVMAPSPEPAVAAAESCCCCWWWEWELDCRRPSAAGEDEAARVWRVELMLWTRVGVSPFSRPSRGGGEAAAGEGGGGWLDASAAAFAAAARVSTTTRELLRRRRGRRMGGSFSGSSSGGWGCCAPAPAGRTGGPDSGMTARSLPPRLGLGVRALGSVGEGGRGLEGGTGTTLVSWRFSVDLLGVFFVM
jgi:hypothetical protein